MSLRSILCLLLPGILALGVLGCEKRIPPPPPSDAAERRPSGLVIDDLKVGTGQVAGPGSQVRVHYVGRLENGKKFDASTDRGVPFSFTIGRAMVIRGWDEGVQGMRVGGQRRLWVPPELGYGSAKMRGIPPNSTLVFEIELLSSTAPMVTTPPEPTPAAPAPAASEAPAGS